MSIQKWPDLPYQRYKDTYHTIHLWSQIIGKVMVKKNPWLNHSWHITLQVTPVGLTSGSVHCGDAYVQMDLDFSDHQSKE
jgi:hypothetical protein